VRSVLLLNVDIGKGDLQCYHHFDWKSWLSVLSVLWFKTSQNDI